MKFLLILGLFATVPWISAVVYQDLDLESVVIEDDPDDGILLEPEETTTQVPVGSGSEPTCTNANGVPGTCMKFEECFPYAEGYDQGTFDTFQLYDILKEAATPCEGTDNLICCPNYTYGIPIRKPQFEGQTTTKPPVVNSTSNNISRNQNCGANKYQDLKVVGGRKAEIGEFPFAVALLNRGRQFCGGSLISEGKN